MKSALALPYKQNELQENMTEALPPTSVSKKKPVTEERNVAVPDDRTALFIGQKGAKQKALEQKPLHAVLSMKKGTPEQARQHTGWFQSPYDGQWRFEIDDSKSTFKKPWEDLMGGKIFGGKGQGKYKLSDIFEHPELFSAYPELRNINIVKKPFLRFGISGSFNPSSQTIQISPRLNTEKAKSTLIHELQHWIQYKEGFPRGGNKNTSRLINVIPNLKNLYNRHLLEASEAGDKYNFKSALKNMGLMNKLEQKKPEIEKAMADIKVLQKKRIGFDVEIDKSVKRLEYLIKHKLEQWDLINRRYAKLLDDHLKTLDLSSVDRFKLWDKKQKEIDSQQGVTVKKLQGEIEKLQQERSALWKRGRKNPFPAMIKPLQSKLEQTMKPFEFLKYAAYRLLAGEQEARISSERSGMALQERREKPPYADAIKPDEAILRYNK